MAMINVALFAISKVPRSTSLLNQGGIIQPALEVAMDEARRISANIVKLLELQL